MWGNGVIVGNRAVSAVLSECDVLLSLNQNPEIIFWKCRDYSWPGCCALAVSSIVQLCNYFITYLHVPCMSIFLTFTYDSGTAGACASYVSIMSASAYL
jgi:hypothetical protein